MKLKTGDIIGQMFLEQEEFKLRKLRARLEANGVLQPKQINKSKKKTKKKKRR